MFFGVPKKEKNMMNKKNTINIGGRIIGEEHSPFIIVEIGINHEGSLDKAKKMIDDAKKCGAECVKFQSHVIEDEMIENGVIPGNAKESIWDIMRRCAFSEEEEIELKEYVESLGMIYLCTPFSRAAADRLQRMGVAAFKIGSGECNNYPLIKHIALFGKPVILSTGMNNIESVKKSVAILKKAGVDYALLHCTSIYPTPYDKIRLNALSQIKQAFEGAVVGISDHSLGNYTSFASIPLGASIIEKHFTSDKNWPGPDVPISITPPELKDLIEGSKAIHQALGGEKEILNEEEPTIKFAYACVVTINDVKEGDIFDKNNLWVKRPGTGEILADEYEDILGRKARQNIKRNTQVKWEMVD
jgi:N-acetylneuraminate synthase